MLYSMARRYDEFPGSKKDSGSSIRGALKGWYRHGACRDSLWPTLDMPPPREDPKRDWWQDAAKRPLGAYYRVDTRSVTDMHVALNEVGVAYASAVCHSGWDKGFTLTARQRRGWQITPREASPSDGGHAFVIFGYTSDGFRILNSWGPDWGEDGVAILSYEDWLANAMDCWVAQMGVVTEEHKDIAGTLSLRKKRGRVVLASERTLRNREISPFIVNMENNGELSTSGEFRTQRSDLEALFKIHLKKARADWKVTKGRIDVALYAHGGLTGEDAAASTAAEWIPALYDAKIFPIFLMWETDLISTLENRLADFVHGEPRRTGGPFDSLLKFWNERLEQGLAAPGSMIWGEMKQNARAISENETSGGRLLYQVSQELAALDPKNARLHLIGHSAGSIVHCYLIHALAPLGWTFQTVNFMAPAATVDLFRGKVLKHLRSGVVRNYHHFQLRDDIEQQDPTCRPILGYGRSLLYLVSESFEGGRTTPILGMERHFAKERARWGKGLPVRSWSAPMDRTESATHGGFDNDPVTRSTILKLIKGRLRASR
jgi:hypothetical protein